MGDDVFKFNTLINIFAVDIAIINIDYNTPFGLYFFSINTKVKKYKTRGRYIFITKNEKQLRKMFANKCHKI